MAGIKKITDTYFSILLLGFILGILSGTVLLSALISYRMDNYQARISYLESSIEDRDIRLNKLEESINKTKVIVKVVEVHLTSEETTDTDLVALEKHIKEKYQNLLGKEVKNIDVDLLPDVIDNRIMIIDEKLYQIKLTKIMLTEKLILWVNIERRDKE